MKITDEAVEAADLVKAARGSDKALIAGVDVFDIYRGAGIEAGRKSIAIEITVSANVILGSSIKPLVSQTVSPVIAKRFARRCSRPWEQTPVTQPSVRSLANFPTTGHLRPVGARDHTGNERRVLANWRSR